MSVSRHFVGREDVLTPLKYCEGGYRVGYRKKKLRQIFAEKSWE